MGILWIILGFLEGLFRIKDSKKPIKYNKIPLADGKGEILIPEKQEKVEEDPSLYL